MSYIIKSWALIRRGELTVTPESIEIHPDFLHILSREEFETAFRQAGEIFSMIMTGISETPERFGMPLFEESETRYGAPEAQDSRYSAWRPMKLLYAIFINGSLNGRIFSVDIQSFRQSNKIKNTDMLLNALSDYGFVFSGLTNGKITPKTIGFTVEYPENNDIIIVMEHMAQKAEDVSAEELFTKWSYRLLAEGFGENSYNDPFYAVYDKTRTPAEHKFISTFHDRMREMGYHAAPGGWNEGPGICYYDKESVMKRKGPYIFRILDWMGDLRLLLRICDAEKCIEYYFGGDMPDEINKMFLHTEPGCSAHLSGSCKKGVSYIFQGETRWHCGCCGARFWLHPRAENILQYFKLVEIGKKRRTR